MTNYRKMTAQDIWNMVQAYEGKPPSRVPTIDEVCESLKKNGPHPTPPILRTLKGTKT